MNRIVVVSALLVLSAAAFAQSAEKAAISQLILRPYVSHPWSQSAPNPPLVSIGGDLFFFGGTQESTPQGFVARDVGLWRTDGTNAGTSMIAIPYSDYAWSHTTGIAAQGALYYTTMGSGPLEVWKTDPLTMASTLIEAAPANSRITAPVELNGAVFYIEYMSLGFVPEVAQLRRWDGASATTIATFKPGNTGPSPLYRAGNRIFFISNSESEQRVYVSDGTAAGTSVAATFVSPQIYTDGKTPRPLGVLGGEFVFWVWEPSGQIALYKTNGTTGATWLSDVDPPSSIDNEQPALAGNMLYFEARTLTESSVLVRTDGTSAGTLTMSLPSGGQIVPRTLISYNGAAYFCALGQAPAALWRADASGLAEVARLDGPAWANAPYSTETAVCGGLLFVKATTMPLDPLAHYQSFVRSDGTAAGTVPCNPFPAGTYLGSFLGEAGGKLLIAAGSDQALWFIDPTGTPPPAPTVAVPTGGTGGCSAIHATRWPALALACLLVPWARRREADMAPGLPARG